MDALLGWIPVILIVLLVIWTSIRVVPEYQRLVVLRLGRSIGEKGPGVVLIFPIIDRAIRVDLRELFLDIPQQTCITRDNAPINIDFLVYWKVVDPSASVLNVQDFAGASQGIATTTLRAVVGDIPLDDVLAKREQINTVLRTKLDEVTERWGVKVTSVEIREIQPPVEVQTAMNKQMAAERSRRAVVLEADGTREAAIKVAEGDKQSAILKAEGDRQATILRAEADRQAAILRAEGFALALQTVFQVAQHVDAKTMGLQYLDALRALGASPATKIVFPLEFTTLLRPFAGAGAPGDGGR
ncbi:MAG TPA: SPFH domain-containing protein [Methylomirabilota bacterium]|jgi:regulator of protease activity HflC (stomatin/prohibitin superfamily)|nr:SPFH domain-containing protein [Methylomirabilota bacterium]